MAVPSPSWGKTCISTGSGRPTRRQVRPGFVIALMRSFFFASTEITSQPRRRNRATWVLLWRNWASRSGGALPSMRLTFAWREAPRSFSRRPTVSASTRWPPRVSSPASR